MGFLFLPVATSDNIFSLNLITDLKLEQGSLFFVILSLFLLFGIIHLEPLHPWRQTTTWKYDNIFTKRGRLCFTILGDSLLMLFLKSLTWNRPNPYPKYS